MDVVYLSLSSEKETMFTAGVRLLEPEGDTWISAQSVLLEPSLWAGFFFKS